MVRPGEPNDALAIRSRMASTPLFDAASSSCTSKLVTGLDGHARGAHAARLAVDGALAVEDLGQDAGGRGLARAARSAQQVGVTHPILDDGVAQRRDEVVLTSDLGEALRPVAAVERLVGHRRRAYRSLCRAPARGPAPPCDGQATCGTSEVPVRAAAFRP